MRLTASIGVATCPEDGRTESELLHSVEEAMNLVKSTTGDGIAATKIGISHLFRNSKGGGATEDHSTKAVPPAIRISIK